MWCMKALSNLYNIKGRFNILKLVLIQFFIMFVFKIFQITLVCAKIKKYAHKSF